MWADSLVPYILVPNISVFISLGIFDQRRGVEFQCQFTTEKELPKTTIKTRLLRKRNHCQWIFSLRILIHSADPQSRPVVIIVFARVAHLYVHTSVPTFQNLAKQNKVKTMFTTGETVGLAEWIIDDTCLVLCTNWNVTIMSLVKRKYEEQTLKCWRGDGCQFQ